MISRILLAAVVQLQYLKGEKNDKSLGHLSCQPKVIIEKDLKKSQTSKTFSPPCITKETTLNCRTDSNGRCWEHAGITTKKEDLQEVGRAWKPWSQQFPQPNLLYENRTAITLFHITFSCLSHSSLNLPLPQMLTVGSFW